jgi:hypothetical protein
LGEYADTICTVELASSSESTEISDSSRKVKTNAREGKSGLHTLPCSKNNVPKKRSTIKEIVQGYVKKHREGTQRELRSFEIIKSLDQAIERAGLGLTPGGKKFSHQRRLSRTALETATRKLQVAKRFIKNCRTFDDLMMVVRSTTGNVKGVGQLYIYDTALRLGAYLHISPKRVYLHAGTRRGARAIGLNPRRESVSMDEIPRMMQKLEPREVEDLLCIYEDELNQTASARALIKV